MAIALKSTSFQLDRYGTSISYDTTDRQSSPSLQQIGMVDASARPALRQRTLWPAFGTTRTLRTD
jgi:hypothetical protein